MVTTLDYLAQVHLIHHFWPIACGVIVGYIVSDFLSGFVHWFCDTFFEEDTPIIGRALIYPFRDHHRDPTAMTHHGFLEMYANSCVPLIPILFIVWGFQQSPEASLWQIGIQTFLLTITAGAFATNQFHSWAHTKEPPQFVRWLQSTGLIVPPQMHEAHHIYPHRNAYCVTSGWMNGISDRLRVWSFMEYAILHLGVPKSRTAEAH